MQKIRRTLSLKKLSFLLFVLSSTACSKHAWELRPEEVRKSSRVFSSGLESSFESFLKSAQEADYVLFGEIHGQARHHLLQADLIEALSARKKLLCIGFEQLNETEEILLQKYRRAHTGKWRGIPKLLQWEKKGWPDWKLYEPVFLASLRNIQEIIGLNFTNKQRESLRDGSWASLPEKSIRQMKLESGLPSKLDRQLSDELQAAHPFITSAESLQKMNRMQRGLDAWMAHRAINACPSKDVDIRVLILGNGHARKDRGVPFYIGLLEPGARVMSILSVTESSPRPEPDTHDWLWISETN